MPRRDPEQCERGTLGSSPALLPIAQRVDAYPQRLGKLLLSESDEATQRGYVVATGDVTSVDAFTLLSRYSARKVPRGQFRNVVSHRLGPSTLHTFASPFLSPHERL